MLRMTCSSRGVTFRRLDFNHNHLWLSAKGMEEGVGVKMRNGMVPNSPLQVQPQVNFRIICNIGYMSLNIQLSKTRKIIAWILNMSSEIYVQPNHIFVFAFYFHSRLIFYLYHF